MTPAKPITAWWFSDVSRRLRYSDHRQAALGITHILFAPPEVGYRGFHGSRNIISALEYAFGPVVWRVELFGEVSESDDKRAAQRRKYIAGGVDITAVLGAFGRWCALQVIDLWDAPAPVRDWLESEGGASLRAAARDSFWNLTDRSRISSQAYARWSAHWTILNSDVVGARKSAQAAIDAYMHAEGTSWYPWNLRHRQNARLTEMVSMAIEGEQGHD